MGTMAGSVEEIGAAAAPGELELRATYESGRTRPLAWRQSQLRGLLRLLAEKEEDAFRALHHDLGKHRAEAYRDEVSFSFFRSISAVAARVRLSVSSIHANSSVILWVA